MQVNWQKCKPDKWCTFDGVDLSTVKADGVYIIWHAGNPSQVVYVGQGDVSERIGEHRTNAEITQYASKGKLYVTWAKLSASQKNGVERYLADKWNPLVGDAHPVVFPIAVNSPW